MLNIHIIYVISSHTINTGANNIIKLNISGGVIIAIPNKTAKYIYFLLLRSHIEIVTGVSISVPRVYLHLEKCWDSVFFSKENSSGSLILLFKIVLQIKTYRFGIIIIIIIKGIIVNNILIILK